LEDKKSLKILLPLYFIFAFVGCLFTILTALLDINSITSSSLIAIIIAMFTIIINDENHYSWAAFCGTFAGMISLKLLSGGDVVDYTSLQFIRNSLMLSIITGLFYCFGEFVSYKYPKAAFDGYGGKLGTIAFLSVVVFSLVLSLIFNNRILFYNRDLLFDGVDLIYLLSILSALAGALVSMEIKNTVSSLNDNYRVLTVAITGIIGGILVSKIPHYGIAFAQAWYAGAFVGMSSFFVLMLKRDYFISGILSGLIFVLTKDFFPGFGGKLGFIAFVSVVLTRLIYTLIGFVKSKTTKAQSVVDSLLQGEQVDNETVNDDYAQQLVESLLRAKGEGGIISDDNSGTQSHLVADYGSDNLQFPEAVSYFLQSLPSYNFNKWALLKRDGSQFVVQSFENISEMTNMRLTFNVKSRFVKKVSEQSKILGFAYESLKQRIFQLSFDEPDLKGVNAIYIVPIFNETDQSLNYILFILDNAIEMNSVLQNYNAVKLLYSQIFQT